MIINYRATSARYNDHCECGLILKYLFWGGGVLLNGKINAHAE